MWTTRGKTLRLAWLAGLELPGYYGSATTGNRTTPKLGLQHFNLQRVNSLRSGRLAQERTGAREGDTREFSVKIFDRPRSGYQVIRLAAEDDFVGLSGHALPLLWRVSLSRAHSFLRPPPSNHLLRRLPLERKSQMWIIHVIQNRDNSALSTYYNITKQMERRLNKIRWQLKTNLDKFSFKVHMLNKMTQNQMSVKQMNLGNKAKTKIQH